MAKNIVIITTVWGYEHGGINTFNIDFCNELVRQCSRELFRVFLVTLYTTEVIPPRLTAIVLKPGFNDDGKHIYLSDFSEEILENLFQKLEGRETVFVGHDMVSGDCAIGLRDLAKKRQINAIATVFHHMNYFAYQSEGLIEKKSGQERVLRSADVVFAVGPKLENSAKRHLGNGGVHLFIPGLTKFRDLPDPVLRTETLNGFTAITWGRINTKTDKVKQYSLAVAAFGKALHDDAGHETFPQDSKLVVVGIEDEKVQQWLQNVGGRYNKADYCHLLPYEKRDVLHNHLLKDSHLGLMLSTHEGFGLTALESISAEIPTIISRNSGIYELLERMFRGSPDRRICSVNIHGQLEEGPNEEDVSRVSQLIADVKNNYEIYLQEAQLIKKQFADTYSWEKSIDGFITVIEAKLMDSLPRIAAPENVQLSDLMIQQCSQLYKAGDIRQAADVADTAFEINERSSKAFYWVIKTGIRLDRKEYLALFIESATQVQRDDQYYSALIQYERSIKFDYKAVLELMDKIKVPNLQHFYDTGMSHFYFATRAKEANDTETYKSGVRKALAALNDAKDQGEASGKPHWWVDIMLLMLYRVFADTIDIADRRINEADVEMQLNMHIADVPTIASARIYRLFLFIILDSELKLQQYLEEDKAALTVYPNMFLPMDLVYSVSNRVVFLYGDNKEKQLLYRSIIQEYIEQYTNKSL